MFDEMNAAVKVLTDTNPLLTYWLNWMSIVMLASVLFVWKHQAARWVLASLLILLPIALGIFNLSGNIHLVGLSHIIVWPPLLFYLFKQELKNPNFKAKSVYGIWLYLLITTFIISLGFDIRDVILVILGSK